MRRVQFGPVEGRIVKDWDAAQMDPENIQLLLEVETGELLKLDVSDECKEHEYGRELVVQYTTNIQIY